MRGAFVIALLLTPFAVFVTSAQTNPRIEGQTNFSDEYPPERPVHLPSNVLRLLMQTKEAKSALEFASGPVDPSQVFEAEQVHLGPPNEVDLVVAGIPPMRGADNDWFWIIRFVGGKPEILLFDGTYSLNIMNSRTHGYKDIQTDWNTSSYKVHTVFHFDGRHYRVWRSKATDLPETQEK
jgi:hypothetical protein